MKYYEEKVKHQTLRIFRKAQDMFVKNEIFIRVAGDNGSFHPFNDFETRKAMADFSNDVYLTKRINIVSKVKPKDLRRISCRTFSLEVQTPIAYQLKFVSCFALPCSLQYCFDSFPDKFPTYYN